MVLLTFGGGDGRLPCSLTVVSIALLVGRRVLAAVFMGRGDGGSSGGEGGSEGDDGDDDG